MLKGTLLKALMNYPMHGDTPPSQDPLGPVYGRGGHRLLMIVLAHR